VLGAFLLDTGTLEIPASSQSASTYAMTQTEAQEPAQDGYEDMPGGPGAPMPISQLSVRPKS
jgi:hypothetical protein